MTEIVSWMTEIAYHPFRIPSTLGSFPVMQSIMCAGTVWLSLFCYVGIKLKELLQQNADKLTSITAMSYKLCLSLTQESHVFYQFP